MTDTPVAAAAALTTAAAAADPAPPGPGVHVKATRGLLLGRLVSSTLDRVIPHLAPAEAAGILKDLGKAVEELEAGQQALEAEAAALRKAAGAGAIASTELVPAAAAGAAPSSQQEQEQQQQSSSLASPASSMVQQPSQPHAQQHGDTGPNTEARLMKKIRAYQRLAREQGAQLERLRREKEETLQQVVEAHKGWQLWRAQQREEESAAERRAIEAEVKARLQEQWAAKGEARARREGKEVEKLTSLALALQGQVSELHQRVAALTAENADLRLQLEVANACLGGSPRQQQLQLDVLQHQVAKDIELGEGDEGLGGDDDPQQHQMSSTRHHYYYTAAGPPLTTAAAPAIPAIPGTAAAAAPALRLHGDEEEYDSDDPARAPPPESYADITRSCLEDDEVSISSSSVSSAAALAAALRHGGRATKKPRRPPPPVAAVQSLAPPRPLRQPSSDGDEEARAARAGPGAPGRSGSASYFMISKSATAHAQGHQGNGNGNGHRDGQQEQGRRRRSWNEEYLSSLSSLQEQIERAAHEQAEAERAGQRHRRHRRAQQQPAEQHPQQQQHYEEARALFQTATAPGSSFEGSGSRVSLDDLLASLGLGDSQQQQALVHVQPAAPPKKTRTRRRTHQAE